MASWGPDATRPTFLTQNNGHRDIPEEGLESGGKVYALRFDDHRLVSGREDGRIHVLDFSPQQVD